MSDQLATKLIDFLSKLEVALPPPEGVNHRLTLAPKDNAAVQHYVWLEVFPGDNRFYNFGLDDADFNKPVADLVNEVVAIAKQQMAIAPQSPGTPCKCSAPPTP